jgi:hypothetical protein
VAIDNRPRLSAIAYRTGTWGTFRAAMIAGLSESRHPQLAALSTRDTSDFSLALLDAWATASDVLTFYQERNANEAYLRTAVERMSVGFLAGLIGYEPRPGVAASTWLAFKLDTAPGAPATTTIPARTQVQSVPGAGQTSQTFETTADIEARPAWNAMTPVLTQLAPPQAGDTAIYLQGTSTNLKQGDGILLVGGERESNVKSTAWDFRRVVSVTPDTTSNRTLVAFDHGLGKNTSGPATIAVRFFAFRQRAALWGNNAMDPQLAGIALHLGKGKEPSPWAETPFSASSTNTPTVQLDAVYPQITSNRAKSSISSWVVFTQVATPSLGEYTALYSVTSVAEQSQSVFLLSGKCTTLGLSGEYIEHFAPRWAAVFAQSDELAIAEGPYIDTSASLPSVGIPILPGLPSPVEGNEVRLDQFVDGLSKGQTVIVTGRRLHVQLAYGVKGISLTAPDGVTLIGLTYMQVLEALEPPVQQGSQVRISARTLDGQVGTLDTLTTNIQIVSAPASAELVSEVAALLSVATNPDAANGESTTTLRLQHGLKNSYDRASVTLCANAAPATHGATIHEVLGNGDGTIPFQTFTLQQSPLTFVPGENEAGASSTLAVTVNDITWNGVDALYGRPAAARVFVTQIADDARTTVEFGDGAEGARLPTGSQNVRAIYRIGLGTAGNLDDGSLTLLAARPLGVLSVTNPLPAMGGGNPELLADARANAGLTIQTLGRVVSLADYGSFARAFAGIGKACVAWIWDGYRRSVLVTVAGDGGAAIDPQGETATSLIGALADAGDRFVSVLVAPYVNVTFQLGLVVAIEPDYQNAQDDVLAAVETALRAAFSFSQRSFAQQVVFSEVITVAQNVTGVLAVTITALYRRDSVPSTTPPIVARLPCSGPIPPQGTSLYPTGAELLTLDPGPLLELSVMT